MKSRKQYWLILFGIVLAGSLMGEIPQTLTIPGSPYTAYDIPENGSDLVLYINAASDYVIDNSSIHLQEDTSDTVQWCPAGGNTYRIGTVFSSREWLWVTGSYHKVTGGGGGSPGPKPKFDGKVAAPDVDIESLTEEQEESLGKWLPKGGARTAVNVHAVQCRSPSSSQQTLTWSSGKLSLWTAASGGSMLSGGSYVLGADQGPTYYAQGDNASGSIRDSEIKTAYTISGQGTAYDKLKLTVVGATLSQFATILVNATQDVSVTLSPNPPGITNTLQIVCLSGSGSAVFVPSGGTSSNIANSATVKIKGVTASSVSNNMMLKAMFDGTILASNVFTVVGMQLEITEPNGNPVTDNNFTFNSSSPGVCDVGPATGTSGIESENPNLEWTLDAINGSTQTSNPCPAKGTSVTFTYTTLPSANDFGEKTLTLKHPLLADEYKDTQKVEIFFSRDATNNPGGVTPNWYYYWKQTGASSGTYQYNAGLGYDGMYTFGNNYFEIGPSAKDQDYGLVEKGSGIDNFGSTCLHEKAHMDYYFASWTNGYLPALDTDGDYLKDSEESSMTGLNGQPYDPTKLDTNGDGYNDGEDWACKAENTWTIGSYNTVDWSNPGKQSNN